MSLKVDPKFISSSMATDAELAAHVSDKANPHEVTKTQVGLSNVPNVDTTNPSNITQDSTHRFVTDVEKTLWNNNSSAVQSVAGKTGIIVLDKSDVSLVNVDNTSDINKPISTATQSQLDQKEPVHFIPQVQPDDIFRGYVYQQNSTTVSSVNITIPSAQGTATARSVSSTNTLTKQVRMAYAVSTPATNQQCGVRVAQALWSLAGGFKFITTFAYTDSQYNSGARQFYGLTSATTLLGINSTITVSSLLNIIGIGSDSGDAGLSIYCNDAIGTATKTELNVTDFPANRTAGATSADIFSLELYNAVGSTSVKYKVTNVTTGVQATGTITTDLPSISTMLSFQAIRTSGSSSNACSIDLTKIGCYNLV